VTTTSSAISCALLLLSVHGSKMLLGSAELKVDNKGSKILAGRDKSKKGGQPG
jgi:hypothetical protein